MAPLIPRMQLFEIDDQTWFPAFLRAKVQAALTQTWTFKVPLLQSTSPAHIVAQLLSTQLADSVRDYVFVDFCAGAGGPTPFIEEHLNGHLLQASTSTAQEKNDGADSGVHGDKNASPDEPVQFVLTDLHPHEENWRAVAAQRPNVGYEARPVDAANVPAELVSRYKEGGKKLFRLFNLAFHHFDDPLARAILKNTIETSNGFGIFELQDRSLSSFLTCCVLFLGILVAAPYYAWIWRSPVTLIFTYLIPILPSVLVFDGWVSSLRTRTPEEVKALLQSCGADGGPEELRRWEVRSGSEMHLWPIGRVNWIVCVRK